MRGLVIFAVYGIERILLTLLALLFGWIWSAMVLTGLVKVGPRSTWRDDAVRESVGARRTELRIAASLLALCVGMAALALAVITALPVQVSARPQDLIDLMLVATTVVMLGASVALVSRWSREWNVKGRHLLKKSPHAYVTG